MAIKIGQLIKEVAAKQGLSQKDFGEMINRTKQGAASIYRRATIDVDLLILISQKLDFDFFAYFYKELPLSKFKQKEILFWEEKVKILVEKMNAKDKLLESKEEMLLLQRKYIAELEEKVKKDK